MKKLFYAGILILAILMGSEETKAVTACPYPVQIKQPDGTSLIVTLQGDEHVKWAITSDGYSLLYNKKGVFEYAITNEKGDLIPSGVKAKDPKIRTQSEKDFLLKLRKGMNYSKSQVSLMKSIYEIKSNEIQKAFPTTGNRKLICILIGYTDLAFTKTQSDFNNLLNQVNYTTDGATGSVKDFYLENSYNQFNLTVDVAGPYTASHNMAYYGGNDVYGNDLRPRELVTEAVNLANPAVNYANYDNDGNGSVDGIYVIFAGYGEEAGASSNAIWSHSWTIPTLTLDGVTLSKYACSPELRDISGTGITRVGVICHEFGHVLGAPDFYDTDYSGTGGNFAGTGDWDIMAQGSWNNNGATPADHNAYTKVHVYKWATAKTLSSPISITLDNAEKDSSSFYEYSTPTAGEYFIMENRQKIGFDADIPGNGLIIYHVHSQVASSGNSINTGHPQKMYPVCASATSNPNSLVSSYGSINSSGCPFPGSTNKKSFTDATLPGSISWAGASLNKPITNITSHTADTTITLDFMGGGSSDDPLNFNAVAVSSSQINLSWDLNAGRNVLLASSANGVFGTPAPGVNYSANDTIPGGGIALYAGDSVAYSDTSLNQNTTYFYKIWTEIDSTIAWSTGVSSQAQTLCSGGATVIPFIEQFSATTIPGCWTIIDNEANGQVWEFGTIPLGLTGTTGNYAYLNSDGYGSGNSQNTDLISPTFDFSGDSNISVSFKHYFRNWINETGTFSYSINNGSSWNVIQAWSTTTVNPETFDQIIPGVAGKSQVKFKWNYTGTYGYFWCIDDIEINNPPAPVKREANIKRVPDGYAPAIDGKVDDIWKNVEAHNIDLNFTGETPTLNSATWKAMWDDNAIYVVVEVSENSFWPSWRSGLVDWESDKFELYLDVNENLGDGVGPSSGTISGHYQFAPNFSQTDPGTEHDFNGVYNADIWNDSPASYVYEYMIPFNILTDKYGTMLDPSFLTKIGFDICVIDLDEGQTIRNRAVWSNIGTAYEDWNDMDSAGIVNFVTDEIAPPAINPPENLTADVVDNNNVQLNWDGDYIAFNEGFETGDLTKWDEMIEGGGHVGDVGLPYWQVQSSSVYVYDGGYSALVNWGYNIDTWLISPSIEVTSNTKITFIWQSSYYWNVDPYDNGDLFVKISLDGGDTWTPIWTFGDIGVWSSWTWYQTTIDMSTLAGSNIKVAFNLKVVKDDHNSDVALDDVYIGDTGALTPGTKAISEPNNMDLKAKTAGSKVGNKSMKNLNLKKSAATGYAVYRDGSQIAKTNSRSFLDKGLSNGTYNYYIVAFNNPSSNESDPSNEVEVNIDLNSIPSISAFSLFDINLYPVPAKDVLNVALNGLNGDIEFKVYNMLGKVVYFNSAKCISVKQIEQIKLDNMTPGVYYLEVSDQTRTEMRKFTIE
jgi:M6 family metalloprotease-like protein